jgi:hypothetical protein
METETEKTVSSLEEREAGLAAVAVYTGMVLELPSGRRLSYLFCSTDQYGAGFFVEGARASDKEDRITCKRCDRLHYVIDVATALEEGHMDMAEAGPTLVLESLLAILLRDRAAGPSALARTA